MTRDGFLWIKKKSYNQLSIIIDFCLDGGGSQTSKKGNFERFEILAAKHDDEDMHPKIQVNMMRSRHHIEFQRSGETG